MSLTDYKDWHIDESPQHPLSSILNSAMQLLTLATALTLLAQATASGAALGRRHSIDGYLRENENLIERGAGMVERSANLSARAESTQWKRTVSTCEWFDRKLL
jgi:hypothetical protein